MKERIIIFGTGRLSEKTYDEIDFEKYEIICFWDNDENKEGKIYKGKKIENPGSDYHGADKIVVCSMFFWEIALDLENKYNIPSNIIENHNYFVKYQLLEYYNKENVLDEELCEVLEFIKKHPLQVFNYPFRKKYLYQDVDTFFDEDKGLFYVNFMNKRMYFKKSFDTKEKVAKYYRSLLAEQDADSPHCYFNSKLFIDETSVVVDAGVAEGNFALSIIDKVKKIILIEADKEWIEALKATFEPYKEKVIIINKYLNDYDDEKNITLDNINKNEKIELIKLDIEGAEVRALYGARNLLQKEKIQVLACCYHYQNEKKDLTDILEKQGFDIEISKGYMFFSTIENEETLNQTMRLRRGLVIGKK